MRNILKLVLLLLLSAPAFAACTVGASGDCEVGAGKTYATVQLCENALTAGQKCRVFAGTYNEVVNVTVSGTGTNGVCTSCITIYTNPGDAVNIQGFNITGSNVIIGGCPNTGFTITEPNLNVVNEGLNFNGATGVLASCNTITQVGRTTTSSFPCVSSQQGASHYITLKNNNISWCAGVNGAANGNPFLSAAVLALGDHWLIQGGTIAHVADAIRVGGSTTFVAVVGVTYNPIHFATDAPNELEGQNGGDTHVDFVEDTSTGLNHLLLEGNNAQTLWGVLGGHMWFISQQSGSGCKEVISRFNTGFNVGSAYLANEAATSNPEGCAFWKDYNNTEIVSNNGPQDFVVGSSFTITSSNGASGGNNVYNGTGLGSITANSYLTFSGFNATSPAPDPNNGTFKVISSTSTTVTVNNAAATNETASATAQPVGMSNSQQPWSVCGSTSTNTNNGTFINNIFYNDVQPVGVQASYYSWSGTSCLTGLNSGFNLAFDSSCVAGTLGSCTSGQMSSDSGNVYADPKLVATDGSSFALQASSPAINTATFLTTTTNSGAGSTTLTVVDASPFQDGWGMSGLQPDCIRIGSSTGVCIAVGGINYSTNTITLATGVTWSNGANVYLNNDSQGILRIRNANGDKGAVAFTSAAPPTPSVPCVQCMVQ